MQMLIQAHAPTRRPAPGAADSPGLRIRSADAEQIALALREGREQLLAMFSGFEAALGTQGLAIAFDPVLNLPLWELGHIGWFEEWWIRRNPERTRGTHCSAALHRLDSLLPGADALYDSSNVPHATRWRLALPDADATRTYLARVREQTLALLPTGAADAQALYFFRLALLHEDMHREAWFMMAQHLNIELGLALPEACGALPQDTGEWAVPGGARRVGGGAEGFSFDNELQAHTPFVEPFRMDRAAMTWRRYLPFVQAGGYDDAGLWTPEGWQWRQQHSDGMPLHTRIADGEWQQRRFGHWRVLNQDTPAMHLSAHEAAAWCRFAGRRLPTEFEWESAARLAAEQTEAFDWGRVWEWTASAFAPYAGFAPHPYRDYSAPFFDGRPVLRGGSLATHARMLHPAYRNYFAADRRDVFAGFRSCAVG
ncbi:selenoneine synthase SenA [Simplicispira suum]|nr:selenoneine synthase SenA [Simplicispira suum]